MKKFLIHSLSILFAGVFVLTASGFSVYEHHCETCDNSSFYFFSYQHSHKNKSCASSCAKHEASLQKSCCTRAEVCSMSGEEQQSASELENYRSDCCSDRQIIEKNEQKYFQTIKIQIPNPDFFDFPRQNLISLNKIIYTGKRIFTERAPPDIGTDILRYTCSFLL